MAKKTVNPALIIGLGGTGVKSLFETKLSLIKRYGEIPSCIKLLCFDTDVAELQETEKEILYMKKGSDKAIKEMVRFDASEMVEMPVQNPSSTKRHHHIKKWLDIEIASGMQKSNRGANQIRQKGRFAFFENYALEDFAGRIQSALTDINNYIGKENPDYKIIGKPKIHMIFSPNGGTGGGTFLDFAITIQNITKGDLPLSAWMLLPSFFEQLDNCSRVHQNGYAALMEIDHLMGVDATKNKPWSNADRDNPYTISYDGATDIALGPDLSLFENIFIFDRMMKSGKEIGHVNEMYPRIGDIIYEFISGAGDKIFERMMSNVETDFDIPSNDMSGNKRRNYFSIGLGHISMDRALIKEFKTLAIIEKIINRYLSSILFNTSDEVDNFLDNNKLNELGNNDNDDIIDSLFPLSAVIAKYDKEGSLLPPAFVKGCNIESVSLGTGFLAKWHTKITKTTDENSEIKEESFTETLEEKLRVILSEDGGVNNSIQFLSFLQGQFEVMRDEMKIEAATHNKSMDLTKKTLVDQQELIKDEEDSLMPGWAGKTSSIKEECVNYASKIELILMENMDVIRKQAAERLLIKFIETISTKITLLKQKADLLSSIQLSLGKDVKNAHNHQNKKANYVSDVTAAASEFISLSNERLTGIIKNFDFKAHMLDAKSNLIDLKNKFREYVSNLDEIKEVDNISVEQIMSDFSQAKIKDTLAFLETSSSPCALIENGFTLETHIKTVNNMGFVTTNDKEVSVVKDNKKFLSWDLGEDRLVASGDEERITMVQCEGPFPINALTSFRRSKERYDANEAREKGKIFSHSDTFFSENAQDLYKDDSVENAQIYFGLGSALGIIECTTKKYILHFEGEAKDLSEKGSRNRKVRNHAFNYFKKVEKYVSYVKSEYEILAKQDPIKMKKLILEHFDTIYDAKVIRKQKTSCTPEELKYLRKERLAVANYALDNAYLDKIGYMQRKDEKGIITEQYSERELRNNGLKFDGLRL